MTWIDWVIAAFALFAALQGLRRGLAAALIGLIAVLVAYLAASAWYRPLGDAVQRYMRLSPQWSATVAFAVLLLVVYDIIGLLTVMGFGPERVPLPSRISGMVIGVVRGIVLAVALLVVVLASPPSEPIRRDVDRSTVASAAVTTYRGGLRALAKVLPAGTHLFGTEDTRF